MLAPSAHGLLDRCEATVRRAAEARSADEPAATVVDVGTGAGILAIEAARRWPSTRIFGTDPSGAMLEAARMRAATELSAPDARRVDFRQASADALPFEPASVDLLISSFVYQLVRDRVAALREAYRVLRPGGWIAFVTWIQDDEAFPPSDAFDAALDALDVPIPDADADPVSGDYPSTGAAAAQLRRIGFERIRVEQARLQYRWDADSYLETQERLWETELMASLDGELRARLLDEARRRLHALEADAFHWRAPIVYALAQRPASEARRISWRRR